MGLLSDALRWINPPRPEPCDAAVDTANTALACDLLHPHPERPHWDKIQRIQWLSDDDAAGVDW